mgnify:CR=1 FL=1
MVAILQRCGIPDVTLYKLLVDLYGDHLGLEDLVQFYQFAQCQGQCDVLLLIVNNNLCHV